MLQYIKTILVCIFGAAFIGALLSEPWIAGALVFGLIGGSASLLVLFVHFIVGLGKPRS